MVHVSHQPTTIDAEGDSGSESTADAAEVPPSTGALVALTWLLAPLIAMAVVVVPLATVVSSRHDEPVPLQATRGAQSRFRAVSAAGTPAPAAPEKSVPDR